MGEWRDAPLRRLLESAVGGTWGNEPGLAHVDVACVRGTDFDPTALRVDDTRLPLRSISEPDWARRRLRPGDIVIEKSGGGEQQPVGRAVLFDLPIDAVPTNFAARLRPATGQDPRFLAYLLSSCYSSGLTRSAIKQTTGIQNLDLGAFLATHVSVPEVEVQREIADFLDAQTALIDALIEKKRGLRCLLTDRWQSALSAELDPTSGIRLKHLLAAPLAYGVLVPEFDDGGVRMLRITDLRGDSVDLEAVARVSSRQSAEYARTVLREGDLVVSVVGTLGRAVEVDSRLEGSNVNRALARVQLQEDVPRVLVQFFFESDVFADQARLATSGDSAQPTLGLGDMANFLVGFPRDRSQWPAMASGLAEQRSRLRGLTQRLERQTDLLREHRQALITAAVTGQLDVSGAAA